MPKILISYRRSDTAGVTGRLFDRLVARYGDNSVFIDVDNIPFGTDFREHIKDSLLASDLVLAIVGPRWFGPRGDGRLRIQDDNDPVRVEIEAALNRGLPIIPVLVDDAEMPQPGELPDTIAKFAYLNAASLDTGRDFNHQMDRLIRSIDRIVAAKAAPAAEPSVERLQVSAAPSAQSRPQLEAAAGAKSSEPVLPRPPQLIPTPSAAQKAWIALGTAAAVGALLLAWPYFTSREQPDVSATLPSSPPVVAAPQRSTTQPSGVQPTTALPPAADDLIRFGVAGPMSGFNAAFGAQMQNGTRQAIEDINAAGGILGRSIALSIGDDVSDPQQGVLVANKFVADGIKFVVGHFNSGVTLPASEVYQKSGILEITPSSSNPKITERGMWNIFRTCGRDDRQGTVAGEYILANFKNRRVAIVHDKTTYGQGIADRTRTTLNRGGMREALYESIDVGAKDFSTLVSAIRTSGADLVYWGGLHTEGALIVRQMRAGGVRALFMGGDGIATDEFANLGGPAVEGALMTFAPEPRTRPEAKAIVEKFRAQRFEPEAYTLYSYAAVEIIKQAAEQARSLDPRKVAEVIRSGRTFKTVIGDLAYDSKGDTTRPDYVMYVWKKDASGKITYMKL